MKEQIIHGLVSLTHTPYFKVMLLEYREFNYDLCYWRFDDEDKVRKAVEEILKEQPISGYKIDIPCVWTSFWPRGNIRITKI